MPNLFPGWNSSVDVLAQKDQLRRRIKQARRDLSDAQRQAEQAQINQHLRVYFDRYELPLAAYMAMPDEVSCHDLMQYAWQQQRTVLVPRVQTARQLTWHAIQSFDDCAIGSYGILEPQTKATPLPSAVLLLVPGVAFTASGQRLGMGGGFYDQVIADLGAESVSVGLAYRCQLVSEIPCEAHDAHVQDLICVN